MARGWESKSVEAQIEQTFLTPPDDPDDKASPEELQALYKMRDLQLSRRRIVQQLENTSNERYAELLRRTLDGLDAEMSTLN